MSISLKIRSISLRDCSSTVAATDQIRQNTNHFSNYYLKASISSSASFFRFEQRASKSLHIFITQAVSLVLASSVQYNFLTLRTLLIYFSTNSFKISAKYSPFSLLPWIHMVTCGYHPSSSMSR